MKKIIGVSMIVSVFIALFVFVAYDSSLEVAVKTFAFVGGLVAFIAVGVTLAIDDA